MATRPMRLTHLKTYHAVMEREGLGDWAEKLRLDFITPAENNGTSWVHMNKEWFEKELSPILLECEDRAGPELMKAFGDVITDINDAPIPDEVLKALANAPKLVLPDIERGVGCADSWKLLGPGYLLQRYQSFVARFPSKRKHITFEAFAKVSTMIVDELENVKKARGIETQCYASLYLDPPCKCPRSQAESTTASHSAVLKSDKEAPERSGD
ncbi:hypothetical protein K491DRAFT_685554 [Lophiostoma macrostomum CBS 122681]|uniref:Uncharacterized protein n=1 Tax=Lophiostoma macrostomum CBS 122681 TaxID=1314788 RepID=A0A6A6SHR6_9PLEO|nr:hypothetical protein K491DRAFT_685554 [Lophiostoma macrostomum CBS 122681]